MDTLKDIILTEGLRPQILRDCALVVEEEVSRKKGVTGLLVKGGFKVIQKLENGKMIENAVNMLLDEFVDEVDPYYQNYIGLDPENRPSFSLYLQQRDDEVSQALLNVTDKRRKRAKNKILIKTYDKLRNVALTHVKESIPAVSRLMQKYAFEQNT